MDYNKAILAFESLLANICDRIEKLEQSQNQEVNEQDKPVEFLTAAEVCSFLSIGGTSLHNFQKKGLIPPHRIGRKKLFLKTDLLQQRKPLKKFKQV